ncbi:unnamed protein product [Caenorhabditis nigoni]
MRGISSEVARNRRRQTTRFFIQSCIQDWLTALVCGTNIILAELLCPTNYACKHLTTFAVDSMSYTVDGFTHIGSTFLNTRVQQVFGVGLYIQGPMTQMIITVNRFIVIMFSPTTVPKYNTHITLATLSLVWLNGICWSTLPGFEENCFVPFRFDHVGFYLTKCNKRIVEWMAILIIPLAVFNNTMNIILAIKLAISAKKMRGISSEVARNRRRQTTRFFIQSCIQDWFAALVFGINIFANELMCPTNACSILTTFAVDSMNYAADGFVMFLFTFKRANKNSIRSNVPNTIKEISSRTVSSSVTN